MGCQADYTEEDLKLIKSVREEDFKLFEKLIDELSFEWEAEDKRNNLVQHIISDLKQLKQKING